jgi:phosphoglycerate dehydrogenase-like enzyme
VSVAETTIGLIIGSLRYLSDHNDGLRGDAEKRQSYGTVHELTGRTVGIVGMGEVGKRVMDLLRPFSCRVLVYDPDKSGEEVRKAGGTVSSLDELLASSDIVSLHAPNIPRNEHMISADLLKELPDDALLVNTARGQLVDEGALIDEVRSGRIRCALDVVEGDPRDVSRQLEGVAGVILTPHIAGMGVETRRRQGDVVVEDLRLFFDGKSPVNRVSGGMMAWMA